MKFMQLLKAKFILLVLGLFATTALAAIPDPVRTLENVTDKMLNEIQARKAEIQQGNEEKILRNIVEKVLMPYVDEDRVARSVIGRRDLWRQATPQQRQEFIDEFTNLLIGTYSSALTGYQEQQIRYFPVRGKVEPNKPVQVQSKVEQPDGPPIELDYRLIYRNGQWKVYDISVGGVSLVQSYREQFAEILNQPDGFNKLLDQLAQHNANN